MVALCISLGHNSSAVLVRDGEIISGYEEERFTGIKSDSNFPINSVLELKKRFNVGKDVILCVSHWFPDGVLPEKNKYWDLSAIESLFPECEVFSVNSEFTHHDSHFQSAIAFAGDDFARDFHAYVIDGFGTKAEHISVYHCLGNRYDLIDRFYGYEHSLGLFYQYATGFCGMKMKRDEYKMLAYETHIIEILGNKEITLVNDVIDNYSSIAFEQMVSESRADDTLDTLIRAKSRVEGCLDHYLHIFPYARDEDTKKIMVSYFAQRHLENVVMALNARYNPDNLLVVGGVFYNVKLNHLLCNAVPGKFCAMPLAGDQGAGIGVYQHYFGDLQWPGHLFWGHRTLDFGGLTDIPGICLVKKDEMFGKIKYELNKIGFVNAVRGAMEYGPRALCHTSTLALPETKIGAIINRMNGRTDEMPFGLVMTESQARNRFYDIDKVHKSLEYMIMARKFRREAEFNVLGGAHYYPLTNSYTCRPQVTRDPLMVQLHTQFGPLINTSLNYHGTPIVYSTDDIIRTHELQKASLRDIDFKTLVEV